MKAIGNEPSAAAHAAARLWCVVAVVLFATSAALTSPLPAASAGEAKSPRITVKFFSGSGVTLRHLVEGGDGGGTLLYYRGHAPATQPSLAVHLVTRRGVARATVFGAPARSTTVPVSFHDHKVVLAATLQPALAMRALGGWWLRRGIPNYSLRAQVFGSVKAEWGEPAGIPANQPAVIIETAANSRGVPQWDYRRLVPEFPGMPIIRATYSQRECQSPMKRLPSASPLWPYVASVGSLRERAGVLLPPILVNWKRGKVTNLAEIVSLRLQNCGYGFYSIEPVRAGRTNTPNFESPWGFYDLSGQGIGLPNLIIRTEHFHARDRWSIFIDPETFAAVPLLGKPSEVIRYSWADHPGNLLFDYKVDVFGFHPYTRATSLAGGKLRLMAPSHDSYPTWVIDHQWPAMTFVDSGTTEYGTSEGIYAWSSRGMGDAYWRGWTSAPDLTRFETIPRGLRGEYRIGEEQQPILYASPIDRRLHLLRAQAGLWDLGPGVTMQERNLTGGQYIDDWRLVRSSRTKGHGSKGLTRHAVEAELTSIPGYLVYTDHGQVVLRQSMYSPDAFHILPPVDRATWRAFGRKVRAYRVGRDPRHLLSWLSAFPGGTAQVLGARLSDPHVTSGQFRATLVVDRQAISAGILNGLTLPSSPGRYLLTYGLTSHEWSVEPATAPKLSASLQAGPSDDESDGSSLRISIRNAGSEGWRGTVAVRVNGRRIYSRTGWIEGSHAWLARVSWRSWRSSSGRLVVRAGKVQLLDRHVHAPLGPRPDAQSILMLSGPGTSIYLSAAALLLLAGATFVLARQFGPTTAHTPTEDERDGP